MRGERGEAGEIHRVAGGGPSNSRSSLRPRVQEGAWGLTLFKSNSLQRALMSACHVVASSSSSLQSSSSESDRNPME